MVTGFDSVEITITVLPFYFFFFYREERQTETAAMVWWHLTHLVASVFLAAGASYLLKLFIPFFFFLTRQESSFEMGSSECKIKANL